MPLINDDPSISDTERWIMYGIIIGISFIFVITEIILLTIYIRRQSWTIQMVVILC